MLVIVENVYSLISSYYRELILGLAFGFIILLILHMANRHKLKKIIKRYESIIASNGDINVEDLLLSNQRNIKELRNDLGGLANKLSNLEVKQSFSVQKIGFIRYNAYDNIGNELSYSIALLDSFNSGFVISSLYGRDNSVSYAKPLNNGESRIPLSAEEQLAIDRALKGEHVEKVF